MERFSYIFTLITFIFALGSMTGWCIELIFRRFFSKNNPDRKWINPGFLVGPCLPLYGFGLIALFLLSLVPSISGTPDTTKNIICIIAMGLMMTVIEYIAGVIFIRHMRLKLWDYSKEWGNFQGIICPKFSFFWTVLAALYYFFVQPEVVILVTWLYNNIFYGFFVGVFFGIFMVDMFYSLQLINRIKVFAEEKEIVVYYDELKSHVKEMAEKSKRKAGFLLPFKSDIPFTELVRSFEPKTASIIKKIKDKLD